MGSGNAGKKGLVTPPQRPAQPAAPMVLEIIQYPAFGFEVVRSGPDGKDRILRFYHPDAKRRDYPLEEDAAKALSEKLLAPDVDTAKVDLPPGVDPAERTPDAD